HTIRNRAGRSGVCPSDLAPAVGAPRPRLRADVGMVSQGFNLFPHLEAVDNVTLGPRRVRGAPKAEADAQAMELLERVGLADKATSLPAALSAIGRAAGRARGGVAVGGRGVAAGGAAGRR